MSKSIGQKFGLLTVISLNRIERYTNSSGTRQRIAFFDCSCECGNTVVVRQAALKGTKSCGCIRTQTNKAKLIDISGQKFGRLTVLRYLDDLSKWECLCDCGKTTTVRGSSLKNGTTSSCSCLQKDWASKAMTGILQERRAQLNRPIDEPLSAKSKIDRAIFKKISKAVVQRDGNACVWCNNHSKILNAHHIVPWSIGTEIRFDTNNIVTLCVDCHLTVHNYNYHGDTDPIMTIFLQGYVNEVEDGYFDKAARIELTPN